MGAKEDVLRALEYGKDPYYRAIRQVPSYQAELDRVRKDYNERTWIDFKGFFPKFTTEEFSQRRDAYQAKHGNTVNVPGFSDIIHIIPKARISAEERAAHLWATKRGLPSPLTPSQIETLHYKKFRFLKALASPTPTWLKNYGAVATVLDNVEDGLVTVAVLGRIAAKIAPRLLGRLVPGVGWVLLGSDVLNAVNLISWAGVMTRGCKSLHGDWQSKNPFHAKAAANRAFRIKRAVPTVGEVLEILQTTDQLFGVGLCLGGFMGLVTDTASNVMTYSAQELYSKMPPNPNVNDLTRWANEGFASDVEKFKKVLKEQYVNFKDEAYRLKAYDVKLREDLMTFAKETEGIVWEKIRSVPQKASSWFSRSLIGSMIMSTGKDDFLKEDHTKAFMMLNNSVEGLMPWWTENNPIEAFKDLRTYKFRVPAPDDPSTVDMLDEYSVGWRASVMWPHLNKEYATLEEIVYNYAPLIKDSFQTYCLKYRHEWEAYVAASQTVDFVKNIIVSFSDDHDVRIGFSSYLAAAIDMMDQVYIMEPDTPRQTMDSLADYIGSFERSTGTAPNVKDVSRHGESIGIKWMRTFPTRALAYAAEEFPEWDFIRDQVEDFFAPN